MAAQQNTNRAAHLMTDYVADHAGHPITLTLVGLAFGLITDTEQVNTARADVPQLIETANRRANGESMNTGCRAELSCTERQIWTTQIAAFRA